MPEKTIPYRVFRTVEQSKIVEIVCEEGDEDSAQAFADSIAWSSRNQDNAWINGEEIITDFGAERAE